jgi:creatinine amidohydrolase
MTIYQLETLFPEEIAARLAARPLLVLPFGTIEWHSHHLPVGLDGLVAAGIGRAIADRSDGVLAPVSYAAVGGVPYPYTLDLPIALIEPLLVATFEQYGAMGFRVIVAFTGHFGLAQTLTLKRAALTVMRRAPVTILPVTEYDLTTDRGYTGDHAGEGETSLLWALRPDLIRLDAVPPDAALDGVLGADPRGAAGAERGRALLADIAAQTAGVALRLLQDTTPVARADYLEALAAGVRVLDRTQTLRDEGPKSQVPSIGTPAYLAHLQALAAGDYRAAKAHADRKLADLSL